MYKRFLNNGDYLGLVTEEALEQLTRGDDTRLLQAEEAAEESILEYLSEKYEIEAALEVGKKISEYNAQITYPVGAHFYYQGAPCKATRTIHGRKAPYVEPYWESCAEKVLDIAEVPMYSQTASYQPGDIVRLSNDVYECLRYNGVDYEDIRVPGLMAWEQKETSEWEANVEYSQWDVVEFDGHFYTLMTKDNQNWTTNPLRNNNWGLIGAYDSEINNYDLEPEEYVEYEGRVFSPIIKPNSDELKEGHNFVKHDPRHPNVKKHLLRLAVYEIHKLVSPYNVSSVRITDYETTILWLRDAARFKINPQIPRKLNDKSKPITDFAVSTFMREYDPYENPWQV